MTSAPPASQLHWEFEGQPQSCLWRSENGSPAPKKVVLADDRMSADTAYRLACEGTALLWQGDYHQARQMLQALGRRMERKAVRKNTKTATTTADITLSFHQHRQAQAQRARILGMVLVPVTAELSVPLRRAPDVRLALEQAGAPAGTAFALSLRELLGIIGAFEWRKNGVDIPALGGKIHPYYGVFSPIRGEYVDLVAKARPPVMDLAFDIGVGSGVLSAVLAKRGVQKIIATDQDPRALACAAENLHNLGLAAQVELLQTDLFPPGKAGLIVCNPPWLPAKPSSAIEYAVYDPDSRMLRGFLAGVAAHLTAQGEAWLIMSDLAEHLGLRKPDEFWGWIEAAGLKVAGKMDIKPRHGKSVDLSDPLHAARAKEVTSLWRLTLQ
ncbi:methyltransferase [Undibacterium rugosum]|uniref:methyltransferase n=1 Tax=Undibacterium rugosum TaxID=2762291 RepID=UPI001B828A40|nr:class I SAM-dependent methyltransferase [Undibacterium rugosum]MBR7779407.1 class I SAM-dependent methyltransferase [Undibacterium rugosum]